jgi:O-antigen/teichoic acid export membrane protein
MALRDKVISGVIWSTIERFSVQTIRFVVTIILARLLSPGDYGLLGMLTIFIAISNVFIDSGFGHTLIQKKDANNIDYSTIFYYSIGLSFIFYIILFFAAPSIAAFYKQPLLKDLSRVVFLNLIFTSLSGMQNVLVSKTMNFKIYARVSVISYITSGAISIVMAYRGYGVWCLVFQTLCNTIIQTILLWIFNTWRPMLVFSINSFKKLFAKSSSLLATGIVSQIFDNIYYVIIGKFYSNINLGFYTQAKRLQEMPLMTLNGVIQAVTFPALVQIQEDNERLRTNYSKIIQIFMFINIPLMAGLMVCAKPLVIAILTAKWLPILPYLYLFCITGIFFPFGLINGNTMKVKGRFKLMFQVDLIKKAILIILLLISFNYGLYAIVVGQAIYIILGIVINVYFGSRLIAFRFSEQFKFVLPYIYVCAVSILPALFLLFLTQWNPLVILISQILITAGLYIFLSKMYNLYAYTEIVIIIKNKLVQLKNNRGAV